MYGWHDIVHEWLVMVPGTHDNSHDVVVNRTTLIIHQSVYGICVSFELYRIIFGTRLWVLIILTVWYELAYSITSSPLLRFHLDFGYSHKSPSKRGGGIMENWDSPNTIVMQLQLRYFHFFYEMKQVSLGKIWWLNWVHVHNAKQKYSSFCG